MVFVMRFLCVAFVEVVWYRLACLELVCWGSFGWVLVWSWWLGVCVRWGFCLVAGFGCFELVYCYVCCLDGFGEFGEFVFSCSFWFGGFDVAGFSGLGLMLAC